MLGIGVVTYNRIEKLKKTIFSIKKFTTTPFELVVADDGSSDGSREFFEKEGINFVSGQNRGVCWNKNRAIFFLKEIKMCDPIILLEDDTVPLAKYWETDWIVAAQQWGHVNIALERLRSFYVRGSGSVQDPFISTMWSGQCTAFSRDALSYVGYLDTRFKGFGFGHGEHTRRFLRLHFGGDALIQEAKSLYFCKLLSSELEISDDHTYANKDQLSRNFDVLKQIEREQVYRHPWRNDEELKAFRSEMVNAQRLK